MTQTTPRLQLWKEEAAILASFAGAVPDGGTIVEIGTAEGATAKLMRDACADRGVEIYTVDIAPSRIARQVLEGSGVHVIAQPSESFAQSWAASVGRPIDFLFIDGNHDLQHVVADWNVWTPHLATGARVAFHDFDPPRRGGLAHFAVRICGETVRRTGRLGDAQHEYKMLHGRVAVPAKAAITVGECRETLQAIADQVRGVLTAKSGGLTATDPRLAALLSVAIGGRVDLRVDADGLDSLTACYAAEQALHRDYPALAELPSSHTEFLVWGEALQMLDHGWSGPRFPHAVPAGNVTLEELSSFVAREQVRLILLSRMLSLLVDWQP